MSHDHRTMAYGRMDCHCQILRIAEHGTFLALRLTAERILTGVDPGRPTVLDFTGVEAITGAFADELLHTVLSESGVRYEGANAEVHETLQTAIRRRASRPPAPELIPDEPSRATPTPRS